MKLFPTLYKKTSTGKIQTWQIGVEGAGEPHDHDHLDSADIVTVYGLLGGKMQTAVDTVTEGKNTGKINETTPYEQAVAEAQSQWETKKKKRYVESVGEAEAGQVDTTVIHGGVAPMLAHQFDKQGHKIKFPAFAQPKLDGHRCIAVVQDGKCSLWSRTQKRITGVPHIERAIEKLCGDHIANAVFDGELYNHDFKDNFEDLSSFIRQLTPKPGHEVVQYWIYDIVVDRPFEERNLMLDSFEILMQTRGLHYKPLVRVSTFEIADKDALTAVFGTCLEHGYEGAMVRNAAGKYANKRSYDLQKVKVFQDAEYEVIDVEEGRGKMAGKAIFVCKTPEGGIFSCVMLGSLDSRAEYFQTKDKWIGRLLTVKYQDITNAEGVPRFPVGVRFREDI